jgi:hypothetical protein
MTDSVRQRSGPATVSRAGAEASAIGDELPPHCTIIEVRVGELRQLFNSIDPAPFRERDLDPKLEQFIVDWGSEAPSNVPLALLVRLEQPANHDDDANVVRDAIHQYFEQRAAATRGRLRRLLRVGRVSLLIGLAVVTTFTIVAELIGRRTDGSPLGQVLHESLLIGGWVAMWRPLEILLYDWWPIRAEAKLFDRLAVMPVRISYGADSGTAR